MFGITEKEGRKRGGLAQFSKHVADFGLALKLQKLILPREEPQMAKHQNSRKTVHFVKPTVFCSM